MRHEKVVTTYSGGVNKKIEEPKIKVVKKKEFKIEEYELKKK